MQYIMRLFKVNYAAFIVLMALIFNYSFSSDYAATEFDSKSYSSGGSYSHYTKDTRYHPNGPLIIQK